MIIYADLNELVPGLVLEKKYRASIFAPDGCDFFTTPLTGAQLMTIFDLSDPDLNDIIRPFRPLRLEEDETVSLTLEKLLGKSFSVLAKNKRSDGRYQIQWTIRGTEDKPAPLTVEVIRYPIFISNSVYTN